MPASELEKHKDAQLVCPSLERRPVTDFRDCNVDVQLPRAIFIRSDTTSVEQETVKHLFSLISDKFGARGKLVDVFALFGEFQKGKKNVYFNVSYPLSLFKLRRLKENNFLCRTKPFSSPRSSKTKSRTSRSTQISSAMLTRLPSSDHILYY